MRPIIPKLFIFWLLIFPAWLTQDVLAQNCPSTITVEGRTVLCQGENSVLRANAGAGLTYQWIRDGDDLPGQTGETIQVSIAGRYQVRISGADCQTVTSAETEVTVNPLPITPTFTVTPTGRICAGSEVVYEVTAAQEDVVYTWVLGDGSTARGNRVTHIYNVRGIGNETYQVEALATSAATGCPSIAAVRDVVVGRLPELNFTEKDNFQTCLPDTIADEDISITAEITNATQEPYLADIRSYFVNWGDENGEVQYNASDFPISNPNPYTEVGDYEIVIRAIAGNGCEEVFSQIYSVSKEPKANFSLDKKRQEETQVPPCVPVIVTPSDSSTGGNLTYLWSVQPEQGYTLQSGSLTSADPVFLFTQSGVYSIELIVENGCGSDTTSQGIVVGWPQVQLPSDVTSCGPTTIDYSGSDGTGGGGPGGGMGGLFVDKNLGEEITITITITGPTSVTRTFNSIPYDFKYDFTQPGTYYVDVEAVNECGSSNAIYQGQPAPRQEVIILPPLTAAPVIQAVPPTCTGSTATLRASGPTTGLVYNWYAEATGGTPIFTGAEFITPALSANTTFYVEGVNANDCATPRASVAVTVVPGIADNTVAGDQNICVGDTPTQLTGSTPTGGAGNTYIYTWQSSTTGPDAGFAAIPEGNGNINFTPSVTNQTTWFRRLVNSGNCPADTSNIIQITAVPRLQDNTISGEQGICANETPRPLTGTRPTGGDGATLEFVWELSTQGPDAGFVVAPGGNTENYEPTGLTQTTWFRRIASSGGCRVASNVVRIEVLPALQNNMVGQAQTICTGTTPEPLIGSAPTGGSGNFTYLWLSSNTNAEFGFTAAAGTNNGQSYTPGNLTQTTWFRRVVTTASCKADTSAAVQIAVNQGVTNNSIVVTQATVCEGDAPAQLTGSTPSGGTGTYTYLWESSISGPTAGFNPAGGTNTGANYTPPALTQNTWFRRVVTSSGCQSASEAVEITINTRPTVPSLTVRDATACINGSATLAVAPNGDNLTYEWFTAATGGNPIFVGPTFTTPALTGNTTYYVQAVNQSNCASPTRAEVNVTIVEPAASAGEDVTIIQGRVTELRATGGATYRWEPAAGLSNPEVYNPVASPEVTTTYTVTVTTAEGCTATDEVTVTVIPALGIPNAFTPNRDGVNDVWELENITNYPDARVEIFNRWGNRIFSSSGYGTPWDGTYQNKDLPVATYYYMIYLNGSEKPISGNVTIIR